MVFSFFQWVVTLIIYLDAWIVPCLDPQWEPFKLASVSFVNDLMVSKYLLACWHEMYHDHPAPCLPQQCKRLRRVCVLPLVGLQASLVCGCFSAFPWFPWPRCFWRMLIRYFGECPWIWVVWHVLMARSGLQTGGGKCRRDKCPHHYIISWMHDINVTRHLGHLDKEVSAGSSTVKLVFPFLYAAWITRSSEHSRERNWPLPGAVVCNHLEFYYDKICRTGVFNFTFSRTPTRSQVKPMALFSKEHFKIQCIYFFKKNPRDCRGKQWYWNTMIKIFYKQMCDVAINVFVY